MYKPLLIAGVILLIQSALALASCLRFVRYVNRSFLNLMNRYQPKAVVIIPCKGLDFDFEENIRAFMVQEYREYDLIFVTESEDDPAWKVLSGLIKQGRHSSWMLKAGEAQNCGQKVHNLIAAVDMLNTLDRRVEVLVFADSDARPSRRWLANLVAPLGNRHIGATTGFRWFIPNENGGLFGTKPASILLSIWNSSALSLLGERSSFAWGGGMAIRRENFDRLDIKRLWQGTVSDDYVVSSAIQKAGQRIKFVPSCLVASHINAGLREMLEFTTRQIRITRVYSPSVWKLAFIAHTFYTLTFWGTALWLMVAGLNLNLLTLLLTIYALGAATGFLRALTAARILFSQRQRIGIQLWAHALLGPVASLIYFYNVISSALSRKITWRGIGYEMISPRETHIVRTKRPQRVKTQRPQGSAEKLNAEAAKERRESKRRDRKEAQRFS